MILLQCFETFREFARMDELYRARVVAWFT